MIAFILINRQPIQAFVRTAHVTSVIFDAANRKITFRVGGDPLSQTNYVENYAEHEIDLYKSRATQVRSLLNTP